MGKTKTIAISGEPLEKDSSSKTQSKGKSKNKAKGKQKKVKVPGLGGGERVRAVESGPIIEERETEKEEAEKKKEPRIRGKNWKAAVKKIDKTKHYKIKDAVNLVKATSYSKFDGTMELHMVVKNDKLAKTVDLPHSPGKEKKVEIADNKTIDKLKKSNIDFDILLATSDMMQKLIPYAKILGPKGLMPNPKNGTLIKEKKEADKFKGDSVQLKTEKDNPVIHTTVGKVSSKSEDIEENIKAIVEALNKKQIEKAYLTATMSPSVKIDLS